MKPVTMHNRPRIAVHKFSSCDGCQLAFINMGEELVQLATMAEIVHFAEAGPVAPDAEVDIAFIEGSITTPGDEERIQRIRENSNYLITIGACATSGGIQALRNLASAREWVEAIYAQPQYISTLAHSTAISAHVRVDFELWGCPVTGKQIVATLGSLLAGVQPRDVNDKQCLECKRNLNVCVLVTKQSPCMGPVTRSGCGALCPQFGRDCYACFGPAENCNSEALANRFAGFGLLPEEIARRFLFINNSASPYRETGAHWKGEAATHLHKRGDDDQ